jgi:hypothetical protein
MRAWFFFTNQNSREEAKMAKKKRHFVLTFVFVFTVCMVFAGGTMNEAVAKVKVIYMTAGDVNMLALGQNVVGPQFSKKYPDVSLMTVHTGPGNAGSQRIFEKGCCHGTPDISEMGHGERLVDALCEGHRNMAVCQLSIC